MLRRKSGRRNRRNRRRRRRAETRPSRPRWWEVEVAPTCIRGSAMTQNLCLSPPGYPTESTTCAVLPYNSGDSLHLSMTYAAMLSSPAFRTYTRLQQRFPRNHLSRHMASSTTLSPICRNSVLCKNQALYPSGKCSVVKRPLPAPSFSAAVSTEATSSPGLTVSEGRVEVCVSGGRKICVPFVWLRDHCRCQVCYSPTWQKNVDNYLLSDLGVREANVQDGRLVIKWQDDHVTTYTLEWLRDNFTGGNKSIERTLWDGARMSSQPYPSTPYEQHIHPQCEDGLRNTLRNIVNFGFCIVEGCPEDGGGTEAVACHISRMLQTVYGTLTTMVSGELDHSDSAYGFAALSSHTDTTYFTAPAGLQVFHCLYHDGEGGETSLVDGFHAAEELRRTDPSAFHTLATTPIPHEFREGTTSHMYSLATVLTVHPITGQLIHIRFNPYDRAPLNTVVADSVEEYYRSYQALRDLIRSQRSPYWVKLRPGMVLIVDNWRVLHGRSAFTGKRILNGCYLPRDEWTSRARTLEIQV